VYTDMERWTDIRRAVLVEGVSKRQACRRFGIHWQTLQRILTHSGPPGYQRLAKADRPVIGPWLGKLAELIEANRDLPRKQRYRRYGFAPPRATVLHRPLQPPLDCLRRL